ncbi:hypothetical protein CXB51_030617 [Gossypium anomalum]|uniref:Uncharacterized protein n=1 Tax=Gossypium anomalum TaxID=47600 RepID=A0A8J5XUF7_9ROSI|nr:hypothetical protein CXB51_030617 [Gossypium anomalum]
MEESSTTGAFLCGESILEATSDLGISPAATLASKFIPASSATGMHAFALVYLTKLSIRVFMEFKEALCNFLDLISFPEDEEATFVTSVIFVRSSPVLQYSTSGTAAGELSPSSDPVSRSFTSLLCQDSLFTSVITFSWSRISVQRRIVAWSGFPLNPQWPRQTINEFPVP